MVYPGMVDKVKDMPITINGQIYYRTAEVCRAVGISRNTLFRWLKDGNVIEIEHRDYRGWRLFTDAQVNGIKERTGQINTFTLKRRPGWAHPARSRGLSRQHQGSGNWL